MSNSAAPLSGRTELFNDKVTEFTQPIMYRVTVGRRYPQQIVDQILDKLAGRNLGFGVAFGETCPLDEWGW